MIPLSTSAPVRFIPPWREGDADAPVFLIRPGTLTERGELEARLASHPYNAGRVMPWDMAAVIGDAARALLDGEALAQVLEAVAVLRTGRGMESLALDQRQLLIGIDGALLDAWPEYAALRARDARRAEFLPLVAAKQFLMGWEGLETAFTTDKDGRASDDALRALGPVLLPAIGLAAYHLLYAEEQRPLSVPPSKSGPAQQTSPAASKPRSAAKAGRSAKTSGRKTRG